MSKLLSSGFHEQVNLMYTEHSVQENYIGIALLVLGIYIYGCSM